MIDLWKQVFPNDPPWNEPNQLLDRKLTCQDGLIFVAISGDDVVGNVLAGWDGVRGWIYHLSVSMAHRRHRVATRLIQAAEAALADLGCPKINLQVRTSNLDVCAFYESVGYKRDEVVSYGKRLG